jgi:hypothetical protein
MYAWVWRRLPGGSAGKLIGSLLLTAAALALLWFYVFPWAEPLLPFDDVQVTQESGVPGAPAGGDAPGVGTSSDAGDPAIGDHDLPYDVNQNNPVPSATPSG